MEYLHTICLYKHLNVSYLGICFLASLSVKCVCICVYWDDWNNLEQLFKWEKRDGEWEELQILNNAIILSLFFSKEESFENIELHYSTSYKNK